MLFKRITQLTTFLLFFTFTSKSQTKAELTKTTYFYSFTGAVSTIDFDKVIQEVEELKGVTICKAVLKQEQKAGQLIVVVEEYSRTSEGQEMFDITDLKKIILQSGLMPNEITIEPFRD